MKWTSPKELKTQVSRLWDRGLVLESIFPERSIFPKRLVLKVPTPHDLTHAFSDVQLWCQQLSHLNHVRIEYKQAKHRVTGSNTYPAAVWIDTLEDAVNFLGRQREWKQFQSIVDLMQERQPKLLPWLSQRPLKALEASEDWQLLLDLIDWILEHPKPQYYLRQVDLPGIHTKFIEARRSLLIELFDVALPAQAVDETHTGVTGFCARYGFRQKPERIRLRVLDPSIDPLQNDGQPDIMLDVASMSALNQVPRNVFITENETNFLSFPAVTGSWILFGAGYGFASWSKLNWLQQCDVYYWGDIDTHGFAVLDELRAYIPKARSFLMDRTTLLEHQAFWCKEANSCTRKLCRLTRDEQELYCELRSNQLAQNIRLEQERISFGYLKIALQKLGFCIDPK